MISKRLKSLVKYVERCDRIIDIGCDHALLDIYLVKNKVVDKIIVSDVHPSALDSGILNINKFNLQNNIEARLGNGLEVLNSTDNIDTIIISGMGTNTILNILKNDYLKKIKKLILQSNRDYDILRREVIKLGFYLKTEEVIKDHNKYYLNIIFARGQKNYSENELKYGTQNMIGRKEYLEYLIGKKEIILNKITKDEEKKKIQEEIMLLKGLI